MLHKLFDEDYLLKFFGDSVLCRGDFLVGVLLCGEGFFCVIIGPENGTENEGKFSS